MNLKDWEEKRDELANKLRDSWHKHPEHEWIEKYRDEATAALEFLGMPRPSEKVWCEHMDKTHHVIVQDWGINKPAAINFCPICGTPRPGTESKPKCPDLGTFGVYECVDGHIHAIGKGPCKVTIESFSPESKPIELPEKISKSDYEWERKFNQLIDAVDQLSRRVK